MDIEKVKSAQSQEEAREYAIQWHDVFITLAWKFGLENEFTENGII